MMRKLITAGTAAILTLTLAASPAMAKKLNGDDFAYVAKIDCGGKAMTVGAGVELYSTMYDLKTGRTFQPIAWNVSWDGGSLVDASGDTSKKARECAYDDGMATGTVTVVKKG
jgi:hypothetical protein